MNKNYYLNLLHKKVLELKKILQEIENKNYTQEQKKYLISGYIITLDSILEIGISDLHTPEIDELTSLIYYTRQKAVHYGYFNGMHSIEKIADSIVNMAEEFYQKEQKYYESLFEPKNFELKSNNIVIKDSSSISPRASFYKFKSKDGTKKLYIPAEKIFTLTKKSKEKISSYIIDIDSPMSLFSSDEHGEPIAYKEISGDELKEFFKENFFITHENYDLHLKTISEIIEKFIKDPINSIQIMEYASNEQFCRNTIDVIKDFILEHTMFDAYIEHNHLIKDKYSLNKIEKTDYTKLQNTFKKTILQYTTQKDAFFIDMTLKRAKYYFDILNDCDEDPQLLSAVLIQLFETGPKHFSNQFISSSPEFKKCYSNLLKYRQIFSHYILTGKEHRDAVLKFKREFLGFIKVIDTINLDDVRIAVHENYDTYSIIERNKQDFFNYKHEQFLRIDKDTYIGKKIHYSSRNPKSDSLFAIIPYGSHASNTAYYKMDANNYLIPVYSYDENTEKKAPVLVSKKALGDAREVKIDFNLSNLFKAYSELRKVKGHKDIVIHFPACEENDNYEHYDTLDNVILRFFVQGYLPIELLKKTKINTTCASNGIITITDESGKTIANISNNKKHLLHQEGFKDDKSFFSRIDDIPHNFSRRRHLKW